jgi:hypothetical protein
LGCRGRLLELVLASLNQFRRGVGAFIGGFEAGLANRRLRGSSRGARI